MTRETKQIWAKHFSASPGVNRRFNKGAAFGIAVPPVLVLRGTNRG
jgi:hypothetical protein